MREPRQYKYYDFIMAAFVCVLLCSNFIGAAKQAALDLPFIGTVTFGGGILFFPISYFFGDILTEVYGYGRDRRVVWAGFGALVFASLMAWLVLTIPAADTEFMHGYQASLVDVFGNAWRISLGSAIAFWCGSFTNSYVLARLKIKTEGRWLWIRTIGSTAVGELVDSAFFYVIAFWGVWQPGDILTVALTDYVLKTGWEALSTPLTYAVVNFLKAKENEDYYDRDTDFNPFHISQG